MIAALQKRVKEQAEEIHQATRAVRACDRTSARDRESLPDLHRWRRSPICSRLSRMVCLVRHVVLVSLHRQTRPLDGATGAQTEWGGILVCLSQGTRAAPQALSGNH